MSRFVLFLILPAVLSLVFAQDGNGTPGVLAVTPTTVSLGTPFTLLAKDCPGPPPIIGADYSVAFTVTYLLPPGAPAASYSETFPGTRIAGTEDFGATWTIPVGSPEIGRSYQVSAACNANELGGEFVWFNYPSVGLDIEEAQEPSTLTVTPTEVSTGEPFSLLATRCPGPNPVGADYSVAFTVTYLQPPNAPGASYSETFPGTLVSGTSENYEATWTIPAGSPTVGQSYQVTAACNGNELGGDFVFFNYNQVGMTVTAPEPACVCGEVYDPVCCSRNGDPWWRAYTAENRCTCECDGRRTWSYFCRYNRGGGGGAPGATS